MLLWRGITMDASQVTVNLKTSKTLDCNNSSAQTAFS